MKTVSSWRTFGGELSVHDHESAVCACTMRFAVFSPPRSSNASGGALGRVPVVWYLSGLTCTWANVMEKAGLARLSAELGVMVVAPDTSPRGDGVADADGYDLGQGAGFYLTATRAPWSAHYRMDAYVRDELSALIGEAFNADLERQAIMGHSMGGHGALTLHLKNPGLYASVSAFSPIVAPSEVPWGRKAFGAYLGDDEAAWAEYDACALVRRQPSTAHILIDQGEADDFLNTQLRPELFEAACAEAGQAVTVRRHAGYDHSYWFISTFAEDHMRWHAKALNAVSPG